MDVIHTLSVRSSFALDAIFDALIQKKNPTNTSETVAGCLSGRGGGGGEIRHVGSQGIRQAAETDL